MTSGEPLHPAPEVAAAFEKLEKERAEYKANEALRPPPKPKRPRKTQPQRLLEEVIGADGRRADFPSIEEQQVYWDAKDAEYEAYLNEQHARQQRDIREQA